MKVQEATGTTLRKKDLLKEKYFYITDFGAKEDNSPVENTKAINYAIEQANKQGGGCVIVPSGIYKTYTIVLKSNVNFKIEKDAVIQAARTDINYSYEKQMGEGGNYLEPEVNLYVGLQDHGHSYFANSLFYASEQENIMIYGEGKIDGSYLDTETGNLKYTLMGGDPFEPQKRNERGHKEEWYGNKAIALVRCKNIVLADFSLVIGGHFAIIAEGITNMYASNLLVDTTRDAFDIDCCQNVTVEHSVFNSLTDDALVIKASYGAGIFMPSKNILIEDCTVSGYDAGSVYAGVYSCDKLIATDSCGPTGRVKLGTESTCGYEKVTVRRVKFERSRGFALEAVDGADLTDIIFEDSTMNNISSSPIFIRAGERGRYPVTGNSLNEDIVEQENNVRIDNKNWILPNKEEYQKYPIKRYIPSYNKNQEVCLDEHTKVNVINQIHPANINHENIKNLECKEEREKFYYANACGSDHIAKVARIVIRNIKATNVDPRYPIIIMGLMDSKIEDVILENIDVSYRGGITMKQAIEQRQIFTNWKYSQYKTETQVQTLPWLVNPFFAKEECLLPRTEWDKEHSCWKENPYNIPEAARVYPEPSNWGILPAYGIYIRHAQNINMTNISLNTIKMDERNTVALDDIDGIDLRNITTNQHRKIICVENHYKRATNKEYILNEPYMTTIVKNIRMNNSALDLHSHSFNKDNLKLVYVNAPEPGTPKDSCYPYETISCLKTDYQYEVPTSDYQLPLTVFRPFFLMPRKLYLKKGKSYEIPVVLRDPASETTEESACSYIYNEKKSDSTYVLPGIPRKIKVSLKKVPGVLYDESNNRLQIDTTLIQHNSLDIVLLADDNIIIEKCHIHIDLM